MVNDPIALVLEAIAKVAAGTPVDLVALRQRLARLNLLVHSALRSDTPPGIDGLHPDDAVAPLLFVLETLEREGPAVAEERLATYFPTITYRRDPQQ